MRRKIRTIAVCGDLFDNKDVKPEERDALLKLLLHYDALGFILLVINGNHDQFSTTYTNLHYIRALYEHKKFQHLVIATTDSGPEFVRVDGQDFLLFPGFYDGDPNAKIRELCEGRKRKPVVLMHEVIKGSTADNGFPLENGVKLAKNLPVTYIGLGDLHMHQQIPGVKNAWYCGSPIQHDFGEKLPKGMLVVDTEDPTHPEFVELPQSKALVTAKSVKKAKKHKKDLVRLVVTEAVEEKDLPENVVKFEFAKKKVELDDDEMEAKVEEATDSPMTQLNAFLKSSTHAPRKIRKLAAKLGEKYFARTTHAGE